MHNFITRLGVIVAMDTSTKHFPNGLENIHVSSLLSTNICQIPNYSFFSLCFFFLE